MSGFRIHSPETAPDDANHVVDRQIAAFEWRPPAAAAE